MSHTHKKPSLETISNNELTGKMVPSFQEITGAFIVTITYFNVKMQALKKKMESKLIWIYIFN